MSLPPHLPQSPADNEYVHVRCLVANLHKPRNVSRPPVTNEAGSSLEVVRESPTSSDTERDGSGSERSDMQAAEEVTPTPRMKSNSFAGSLLAPPGNHQGKKRRKSFLHLHVGGVAEPGPMSAGPQLSVPRLSITAPPGEQRRHSHGFSAFHGFALRRHSNTVWEWLQVCGFQCTETLKLFAEMIY